MSKSSKIFIIASGLYLFALTFILLTQPQSGYSVPVGQVFLYYALYLPLWTTIAIIFFIATKHSDKNWNKFFFGQRALFWSVLILVALGFAFNFDYQKQSGCFVEDELMFSTTKFIFSLGSILLLSCGFYFRKTKFGTVLLVSEFFLWTLKSLFFNSSLDLIFPGYFTMICWALRFALIIKTLNEKTADTISLDTKTTH